MVQSEEVSRGGVHRASWPHVLLACAGVLACAAAMVNSGASAGRTELHESSDMREIDKMLNRIHKLTKHGYDGHREHSHKTKLVEKKTKESEKRQPAKQAEERLAHKSAREVHTAQKTHEDMTAHEHTNKALHALELAHKHKKPRGHEQKPKGEHSHVNKALQEAMNAEKAAMHSDDKKARGKQTTAKRKSIEKKMMHLQTLEEQISKDFNSVTTFGKKAGYLPPVKMPHM